MATHITAAPTRETTTTAASPSWVLWLAGVASMLVVLDAFVVTTALPTLRADLHVSGSTLEWTVTGYTLSYAVLLMTGAALGERFGRRRVFSAGLTVFALASIACAVAPGIGWLIAARIVQGAGAAAVTPLALALVSSSYGAAERPKALGAFGAIQAIAVAVGPLVGGAVVQGVSWQWIFWLNVPVVALVVWLTHRHVPEASGAAARIDVLGVVLVTVAGFGFVWSLVRGNSADWGSAQIVGGFVLGLAAGGAFVAWERRAEAPMVPPRLFRVRRFALANGGVFLMWSSTFGSAYFVTQYLQNGLGHGPLVTGVCLLPWGAAPVFVAKWVGRSVTRHGERPFIAAGMAINAVALAALAAFADPHAAYWPIGVLLALSGVAVPMALMGLQNAAMTSLPAADLGTASGTFNSTRQLGGAFGVAVAVAAFTAAGDYSGAPAFVDGFTAALDCCAALAGLAALVGLAMPSRRTGSADR